jgi:hypothetical protein
MRIALIAAFALCLSGTAHAQDKDTPEETARAKCGVVAYNADGTFGAAYNYTSCKEAEKAAIAQCVNGALKKNEADCNDEPIIARGVWFALLFCKKGTAYNTFVTTHENKRTLIERQAEQLRDKSYSPSQCTPVPSGEFHTDGLHDGSTAPKTVSHEPDRPKVWVAVARGFGDGRGVSVGAGRGDTKAAAEAAAKRQCNEFQSSVTCDKAYAYDYGCIYGAPGRNKIRASFGSGGDKATALAECRRGGYTCGDDKVVYACVDE